MINFYKFIRICGTDPENAVYPYVYYRQESYMNQEHEIVKRVAAARSSSEEADRLVRDYLPFIKAETAKFLHRPPVEGQDDELSIAMFAFYEAVLNYEKARGTFLAFASRGIRNRLIDHYRKESRHGKVISFDQPDSKDEDRTLLDTLESSESNVEEGQIPMEPDLIKTVLLNLLDNGRKAMEGGGTLQLLGRFEQEKGREGFAFYVKDTGKGMPKEELSRITEAFYMVDKSRARRQGGAGLGLALCAEIVKRHRGRLSFQSVEGRGTLARVWLPAEEEKSCPGGPEHGTRRGKERDGEV